MADTANAIVESEAGDFSEVSTEMTQRPKKKPPGSAPPVNPRWAQSAQPAVDLGRLASRLASGATGLEGRNMLGRPMGRPKLPEVPEAPKKRVRTRKPWGQHTWNKRWHLEQRRSKHIAMLTPGMMLHREWKGTIHRVLVRERDYLHVTGHKVYPTLYSVTVAITGKTKCRNGRWLAPISAVRFWNLRALLVSVPM